MAVFKVETKNKVDIDKKPRVYFTCHPDDSEKYFKRVCNDIFKTHDCAIYYTEDMTEVIAEDEKEVDLGRNNLFVVPVTFKLLTTPNRAMDEDVPYALKEHIPVLPIMMEPGIDKLYSKPNKFGELQYLNPHSADMTEISYEEKLKKYLESVLISDELAKRVRAAFCAYIFLSYRKKDRKYANELMRLIHSIPECRDIAIWFDEFLTPGESFKENIEKILDDCKLFTLLVTPQLLEKVVDENGEERDNYVISTELPLARKKKEEKGIDIIAIEMEETDRDALSTIDIENYVNFGDSEFHARLLDSISHMAITTNNTPEHNFLIGLAYLEGVDVEINRQSGIELITASANAGLIEAIKKLRDIYFYGIGTNVDYLKAVKWAERHNEYMVSQYGEEHPDTLVSTNNLAAIYFEIGELKKALKLEEKTCILRCKILGEEHRSTLAAFNNLALIHLGLGNYKTALELEKKVYDIRCKLFGKKHPDTLTALNDLALIYQELGMYKEALELAEEAYTQRCKILGEEHLDTLVSLSNLAMTCGKVGEYKKELALLEKVYSIRCGILGEEHPNTLVTLNNLAAAYGDVGEHKKALELTEKGYILGCKILGEENKNTLVFLSNLAAAYGKVGEHKKQIELAEKAYSIRYRVLGEEHPNTLTSLKNLATIYGNLGEHKKALKTTEELYALCCKVLGENHPDTLKVLNDLAWANIYVRKRWKGLKLLIQYGIRKKKQ